MSALSVAVAGAAAAGPAKAGKAAPAKGAGVFAKMDANGDGVVSRQEFQAFAQAHKGKAHAKGAKGKAAPAAK